MVNNRNKLETLFNKLRISEIRNADYTDMCNTGSVEKNISAKYGQDKN